jgi:hypothetical protein
MQRHTAASYVDFAILPKEQQNQKNKKNKLLRECLVLTQNTFFFGFP